jgi:hypothetical protein
MKEGGDWNLVQDRAQRQALVLAMSNQSVLLRQTGVISV